MDSAILLLVVEDEDAVRLLLEDALVEGGFQLKLAKDGTEGIAMLEAHKDAVRGLITDINLSSGPDGWEVARRGRELNPALPVVYTSGGHGHSWASKGVPHSTFVAKPFAAAQIIAAISALLNVSDNPQ